MFVGVIIPVVVVVVAVVGVVVVVVIDDVSKSPYTSAVITGMGSPLTGLALKAATHVFWCIYDMYGLVNSTLLCVLSFFSVVPPLAGMALL